MLKAMSLKNLLSRRSALHLISAILVLSAVAPSLGQTANPQPPATIYLIRHAEKLTDGRDDLSWQGFRRAVELPRLFVPGPGAEHVLLPKPDFLFATHSSKHSNRPFETIMPLSSVLNLPISNDVANEDYASLATLLLSGQYAGKVVLVAWHHGNLPRLTLALGATPPYTWPETQFDRIWRIDYRDGKATLTDLPQQLLPGDSNSITSRRK